MNRRTTLISFLVVLLAAGFVLVFMLFLPEKPAPAQKTGGIPVVGLENEPPAVVEEAAPQESDEEGEVSKIEESEPFTGFFGITLTLPGALVQQLRPILSFAERTGIGGEEEKVKEAAPLAPVAVPEAGPEQELTDQELFQILYPQFFLSALGDIQAGLVSEGFIGRGQTAGFSSEKEVHDFMILAAEYLAGQGFITDAEFAKTQNNLRIFFSRPREEKLAEAEDILELSRRVPTETISFQPAEQVAALEEFYQRTKLKEELPPDALELLPLGPVMESIACRDTQKPRLLSAALLSSLMVFGQFFTFPTAEAYCGPTYCTTNPECFMAGADSPGGYNLPGVPCCAGRICGAPIGCFELCGNGSKPFIWDPTTSICGCG